MEDEEHLNFSAKRFFGNRATRASVLSLEEQRLSLRFTTTQPNDGSLSSENFERVDLKGSSNLSNLELKPKSNMQPGKDYPISGQTATTKATNTQIEEEKGEVIQDEL